MDINGNDQFELIGYNSFTDHVEIAIWNDSSHTFELIWLTIC